MCKRTFLAVLLLIVCALPAHAQDDPLRVAIKPLEPFVNYEADGTYSGFSIDLWRALAEQLNLQEGDDYVWMPLETVEDVLFAVRDGDADVGIAGISITREREEFLDFSQPMFNSGLQILTRVQHEGSLTFDGFWALLSVDILWLLAGLAVAAVVFGHIMWFAERRTNPDMPDGYRDGIGEAIWWTLTSIIAVSENHPRTGVGRAIGFLWMIVGILLIAALTADITVTNTVQQLEGSIQSVDDLPGKRIVTVAGTTAEDYLLSNNLRHTTATTIEEAYTQLEAGFADAVVFDAPVLMYYAITEGKGSVQVIGGMFARQDYGIAVSSGSPLREDIDRALLSLIETGEYTNLYNAWFTGN